MSIILSILMNVAPIPPLQPIPPIGTQQCQLVYICNSNGQNCQWINICK